jgi:hypothetical protein
MGMGKGKAIKPGWVVRATTLDRNGQNPEERPFLVIPPAPNGPDAPLCCLAISTKPGDDPSDPAIEMPWNPYNGGITGLYKWCRVVVLWHVQLDQSRIEPCGRVEAAFLADVLAAREIARFIPHKKH